MKRSIISEIFRMEKILYYKRILETSFVEMITARTKTEPLPLSFGDCLVEAGASQ